MAKLHTLHGIDTHLCADCVAWCPIATKEHLLVCTTYQMMPNGLKTGSILLYSVQKSKIILLQAIVGLAGILDLKWRPAFSSNRKILLASANSDGYVSLYSLNEEMDLLIHFSSCNIAPKGNEDKTLALYLDWSPHSDNLLVATNSHGLVNLLMIENGTLCCFQQWSAHKFEAWVSNFDENSPNIIYTGGDDSVMKCFDCRQNTTGVAVWTNTAHSAGVTSFLTSIHRLHGLATGSYDERILMWDTRNIKAKEPVSELFLGGGVWRLRSNNKKPLLVGVACMFAGFKILDWKESEFCKVVSYRDQEDCLGYGIDWAAQENFIAVCSFYDHKLSVCCY